MTSEELRALIAQGEGQRLDFKRGVPRTPFVHGTAGGVFQRRVGKQCLPMSPADVLAFQSERAGLDYSALPLGQARYPDDVDSQALERLRAEIVLRSPALAQQADRDLLGSLRLLADDGTEPTRLTVAGGLLLGRAETLHRDLPQAEVAYFRQRTETDIRLSERLYLPLPLLLRRLKELIEADNEVHSFLLGLQRIDVPALPQAVYREAILNAVAHRNYGLPGNVVLRHFPDRLEVMSPGGFPAGVSPANILRQVVSRNRLLAEVLQRVGYVERAGYGVDMMYVQMLRLGKEPPWFIPDELSVRVVIRDTIFDEPFVSFVQRRLRADSPPTLEHLLVLSHLKRNLELDLATAMGLFQRSEGEASEVLAGMVRDGLLERVGTGKAAVYQLTVETAEQLDVSALGRLLTPAEQEARVLEYVQERGQITNRECQRLCGLSSDQAFKLLARLVKAGKLKALGEKRGRHYIPSDG